MEQRLKERMIGAVVLVGVGILLIPALLDGPGEQTVTRQVELRDETATRRVEISLDGAGPATIVSDKPTSDSGKPDRVTSPQPGEPGGSDTRTPVTEAVPAAPKIAQSEPVKAPQAPVVAESRPVRQGNWTAQVGSFSKKSSAARIIRELEAAGFDAYISEMTQGGRTLYRVRVGPVVSRDEADALVARLKASGHAARVMPHP